MVFGVLLIIVLAWLVGSILLGLALGYIINRLIDQRFPKIRYRLALRILIYLASVLLAFVVLAQIMGIGIGED